MLVIHMNDDERLLTMILRHQAYLDRHITFETEEFTRALPIIARNFRRIFAEIELDSVRELTIRELRSFTDRLANAQMTVYNEHIAALMNDLHEFMVADRGVITAINNQIRRVPGRLIGDEELWVNLRREPMAATGQVMPVFIAAVATNAVNAVTNQVQRAYADNLSFTQTLRSILGSRARNYRDGVFNRINNWHKAMVPTTFQYVSNFVSKYISGRTFQYYRWLTRIDGSECAVCAERHNQVFTHDLGPQPPAHPNCRCDIASVVEVENTKGEFSYPDWLSNQPDDIRDDLLDESPLTLRNFVGKLRRMLT